MQTIPKVYINNPAFRFYSDKKKNQNDLFMGFENEIIYSDFWGKGLDRKLILFLHKYPYLYFKDEPSISGIEINSHPFSWDWFVKNNDFIQDIYNIAASSKRFRISDACGFHIHINKKYFNQKHLIKMIKFFYEPKHGNFLFKISKRRRCEFNWFSSNQMPSSFRRWYSLHYDMDVKGCSYDDIFKKIAKMKYKQFDDMFGNKSSILNLSLKNTIEIRLFK